ncbi:MAG TPA: thrombospondin type 3 repeat-containing protein [Kofleriaceae bacterium]|nr:thrombospondin type 3 repeat-containing protein [Kofleriaceae bacterium]
MLVAGCASSGDELSAADQALVSDATTGGTPGFFFLAPLGDPPPTFPGTFDGSFQKRLTITVHDVDCNNAGIVGNVVQTFSTVFVYPTSQQYKVNLNVSSPPYTLNQCYRVIPRLDGAALGFRDVQVLPTGTTSVAPAGYKKWGLGANTTIAFRLENLDPDGDGVLSHVDNCDFVANADQADADADGIGDACDIVDTDNDGVADGVDNCPANPNPDQADFDADGIGDACDACSTDPTNDVDGDLVCGSVDNCPTVANSDQLDGDLDGIGDACDACPADAANDADGDGVCGNVDNCPAAANADQADSDADGTGDACDACPLDAANDVDGDGVCGNVDNCPTTANADQADADNDGIGDACDTNCAIVPGAIGHWAGDGNANDSIGGANGTFSGSALFGAGQLGQAFAFDGTNFMKAAAFDRTGAFSVSFWAKANAFQSANTGLVSSTEGNVATTDTFQVDWNGTKGYRLKVGGTTAPNLAVNIGNASTTAFQHIVVTYDGGSNLVVYLDGVQTNAAVWTGPTLSFSALKLGVNRAENLRYNGSLDDVNVFSRAITAGEVAQIFGSANGVCP